MMIAEQDTGDEEPPPPEDLEERLAQIRKRGYEVMPSQQTAGVYNLSAPVLGADSTALAALTCPYVTPLNRPKAPDIPKTIAMLMETAATLSLHVRGQVDTEPQGEGV
jgi:DNA-binding IclR family transcriptional regulator